jgi:pimeloyl-ACP methyl ester carboxylesterase
MTSVIPLVALCSVLGVFGTLAGTLPWQHASTREKDAIGTRAMGLRLGPHAVGFELATRTDRTRHINQSDEGTRIGMALWYPAQRSTVERRPAMTTMEYRLLRFQEPVTPVQRQAFEDEEVKALLGWRHVGIVPLTPQQARASLATHGLAVRGAAAGKGRFPVAVVLGGPYYLSTTAELLASHGFVVMAPFRFTDQSNEVGAQEYTWFLENSVRDAEWALEELRKDPRADMRYVTSIGHGGGGLQALLFAMRNRVVKAVVNIDAGNFSTRSQILSIPFYSPRLMRAPYLFIVTAASKKLLDLFDQFAAMKFSKRIEVVLENPAIRHHDLSDVGRAVTAPMGIRGDAQAEVQQQYAAVQEMVIRFLEEHSPRGHAAPPVAAWIQARNAQDQLTVSVRPGIEPAPTTVEIMRSLDSNAAATLADARLRDPEGAVFQESALSALVSEALLHRQLQTAAALAALATELHPKSAVLLAQATRVAEEGENRAGAVASATACAALDPGTDWRATAAIAECKAALERFKMPPSSQ